MYIKELRLKHCLFSLPWQRSNRHTFWKAIAFLPRCWSCFLTPPASLLTTQVSPSSLWQLWHFSLFSLSQVDALTQQREGPQTGLEISRAIPRQVVEVNDQKWAGWLMGLGGEELGNPSMDSTLQPIHKTAHIGWRKRFVKELEWVTWAVFPFAGENFQILSALFCKQ